MFKLKAVESVKQIQKGKTYTANGIYLKEYYQVNIDGGVFLYHTSRFKVIKND